MDKFFRTEIIEEYKKKHNLSNAEFCKICNISQSTLNRVISHDKNLPLRYAINIIKTLNITLSEFIIQNKK